MKFWQNEIPTAECYLPDGRKIQMDFIVDEKGYVQSGNGYLNNQIATAIASHVGGWVETTEAEYNEALKKKQTNPAQPSKWYRADSLRVPNPFGDRAAAGRVAGRSVEVPLQPRPDPVRVPTPDQMKPRKGPIPREAII